MVKLVLLRAQVMKKSGLELNSGLIEKIRFFKDEIEFLTSSLHEIRDEIEENRSIKDQIA